MLEIRFAVAKTHKYASRESGDTVEMVERPHGGFSLLLVDAQGSGLAAKRISNLLTSRGAAMIKEGARDGAVARAVHDYLYTLRNGSVSATLDILSVDLQTRTLVVSRNDECPVYLFTPEGIEVHNEPVHPIGIYMRTKPVIVERPLEGHLGAVATSDGVTHAGERSRCAFDVHGFLEEVLSRGWPLAHDLAEDLLARAVELEDGRPRDDVTVAVITIVPTEDRSVPVRRLQGQFPVE